MDSMPVAARHAPHEMGALAEPLTPRETEVLNGLARGLRRPALARSLGVSINTVKYHLRNIYAKLGACNGVQAQRIYFRRQGSAQASAGARPSI
jgi:DNA-binding NarL/FixJ family response regulator